MRNLPTAHYIMVMPWQRLLLRSSMLSQLPSLCLQVANSSFLRCTFCLIPHIFFPKRNCFISPSVTKDSCTCRSFSPVWADKVTSPPCMTRGYFLLKSPLSSPLSLSASHSNSQLPLGDEYIKGLVGD